MYNFETNATITKSETWTNLELSQTAKITSRQTCPQVGTATANEAQDPSATNPSRKFNCYIYYEIYTINGKETYKVIDKTSFKINGELYSTNLYNVVAVVSNKAAISAEE